MAVRIDVPGIGVVEAEGVASEETLQRIAAALEKSSGGLAKDQKDQSKAIKDSTKALKENTTGWVAAGDAFTQSLKNMALTATSVAAKFFANYDTIAASPIKAGQGLLNTAIDLTANLAGGLASSIPIIGGFAKGVIDATAAVAKLANDMFADQLQKNIDALQIYAKTGISFSGGMTQMQNAAQSAGLGIKDFATGVSKAKTDLNFLGMSGGDAANFLADRMGTAAKIVGRSGQNLRQEMLAMGFSYDEQIEVMASYMANMKAAGKLEKMTKEEVAIATRNYAADLKIVADFTGQDAKKQMERARAQQLLLTAQANLSDEERDRLGKASVILGRMGPDADKARQALSQMLIMGTTNVEGYTMGPGRKMIEDMVANIKSGTQETYTHSGKAIQTLQQDLKRDQGMIQISTAKLMGAQGGAIDGFNAMSQGAFSQGEITDDMIAKMREQAENQGTATDQLTSAFQTVYESAQKFKTETEAFVNSKLADYSGILAGTFKRVTETLSLGGGGGSPSNAAFGAGPIDRNRYGFSKGILTFAEGGTLGSGQLGLVGEAGPELISGPAGVTNAKQMRENMARLFDETAKMLTNAKNPFRTALDDVAWTNAGDMSMPYDKVTGTILDPNFVKDLSDKAKGWQDASAMLSEKFSKDSATMAKSDMGEGLDSGFLSDTNKQVLELLQQTRDAANQQTMHMADMLKQMGISTDRLGKIAVNTN